MKSLARSTDYLFIVGCPRSGTTWLAWLLAQHPSTVVALHTGFFGAMAGSLSFLGRHASFGNRVVTGRREGDGDPVEKVSSLSDLVSLEELQTACRPLAETLLHGIARADPKASCVVEKTPENLLHVDFIRRVLPEARFLHIVRDPRAIFNSMRMAAKQWAYPGALPTDPVAFVRNYWSLYHAAAEELEKRSEAYRSVRYEDLLDDGPRHLAGILEWLDLPYDEALCEHAFEASSMDRMRSAAQAPPSFFRSGRADGWRTELPRRHVRAIEYLAGGRMERLGYACVSPNPGDKPLRLRLTDLLAGVLRKVVRTSLGGPFRALLGWARRIAKTAHGLFSTH